MFDVFSTDSTDLARGSGIYVSVDYAGLLRKRSLCVGRAPPKSSTAFRSVGTELRVGPERRAGDGFRGFERGAEDWGVHPQERRFGTG